MLDTSAKTKKNIPSSAKKGKFSFSEKWSLRLWLSVYFTSLVVAAWLIAAFFALSSSLEHIDEFFDMQQLYFAKHLAAADLNLPLEHGPGSRPPSLGADHAVGGDHEEDAIGFAVFNSKGQLLLNDGERGDRFIFDNQTKGFVDTQVRGTDRTWRIVWLDSLDGLRIVAVGQELRFRRHVAFEMLKKQMLPWLVFLPALLGGLLWIVSRSLAPLRSIANQLERRPPDDTSPLETKQIPSEIRPLVIALNHLFSRIARMLSDERAFISDAAHELRSPLMALLVQAEVAALYEDDPAMRKEAHENLLIGIQRSRRLVEQLLTLSRLDSFPVLDAMESGAFKSMKLADLDWPCLLAEAYNEHLLKAEHKNIEIRMLPAEAGPARQGYPELIALLLRNLFNNAVKYTPENGVIAIHLDSRELAIHNSSLGVSDDDLARLTERFFRPLGQVETGSGLGLAIAKRIADIHSFGLTLDTSSSFEAGEDKKSFVVRIVF